MKKLFLLVFFFGISSLLYSQHLPDPFIKSPVFIEHEKGYGTGFFIQDSMFTYFVTAKHNLAEFRPDEENEENRYRLLTKKIKLTTYRDDPVVTEKNTMYVDILEAFDSKLILFHKNQDLVVIVMGQVEKLQMGGSRTNYFPFITKDKSSWIFTIHYSLFQPYDDVRIGDEIFIFGYPTSLGIIQSPQFDYERPLLRKGIVAGKYDEEKTLIIDCPSYPGNSGGPVILRNIRQDRIDYYLVGVVVEFIPYEEKWINTRSRLTNTDRFNSGYSVAVSINSIIELIYDGRK
ncbi:trypsin-like peptidase domain-containing protein [candidate division KSB1 bacterium]